MKTRFWSVEDQNCRASKKALHKKLTEILQINFISIMKNRGFTLIELLVVIAIIGILSSVVLASLTTARTRGQSASTQSQLSNMRAQAELFYSTTGTNSYGTPSTTTDCTTGSLFTSSANGLLALLTGVKSVAGAGNVACSSTALAWAVAAVDPASTTAAFCVDSTGISNSRAGTVTARVGSGACN
jgi:prepilin-type N-terminal cleavage/methylation domain-containing protein